MKVKTVKNPFLVNDFNIDQISDLQFGILLNSGKYFQFSKLPSLLTKNLIKFKKVNTHGHSDAYVGRSQLL